MSRRLDCPLPSFEDTYIELPDRWFGEHAQRRDEVLQKMGDKYGETLRAFGVALALLDDWNLPGLSGNPDKWNFNELDLSLIAWVSGSVLGDFGKCWTIPKESPPPSKNGSKATVKAEDKSLVKS